MIVSASRFTFTPYQHDGFSGQLYIAEAKRFPKLLVKSNGSAVDEYYGHHLASLLGVSTPRTYFISDGDLAMVGIEYFEGSETAHFTPDDNPYELAVSSAMYCIGGKNDNYQALKHNGHWFTIDYDECFGMTNYNAFALAVAGQKCSLPEEINLNFEQEMRDNAPFLSDTVIQKNAVKVLEKLSSIDIDEWENENHEIGRYMGVEFLKYYRSFTELVIDASQKKLST